MPAHVTAWPSAQSWFVPLRGAMTHGLVAQIAAGERQSCVQCSSLDGDDVVRCPGVWARVPAALIDGHEGGGLEAHRSRAGSAVVDVSQTWGANIDENDVCIAARGWSR
jgi:hypothetical protein